MSIVPCPKPTLSNLVSPDRESDRLSLAPGVLAEAAVRPRNAQGEED